MFAAVFFGAFLLLGGVGTELVLGSFRHLLDPKYPRERHPRSLSNRYRLWSGRIFLAVGAVLLVGAAVSAAVRSLA